MEPLSKLDCEMLTQLLDACETLRHLRHVQVAVGDKVLNELAQITRVRLPGTVKDSRATMFLYRKPVLNWAFKNGPGVQSLTLLFEADLYSGVIQPTYTRTK